MRIQNKGFTLIELMIVVAIIGILAAVVMPGYRHYVLESQRTDTQGKMLQMVELQERFFIDNFRYTTDLDGGPNVGLGYATDPVVISYGGNPAFNIQAFTCGDATIYPDAPDISRCFLLVAIPQGDQVNDGGLMIDSRGRKIHDFASIQPRDWNDNDLGATDAERAAACPECALFPNAE
ncbi:MAG: type IV pilus assembly protein PilE [Oleispira sp.]|jgi:type IV pilus assembly protein PilE